MADALTPMRKEDVGELRRLHEALQYARAAEEVADPGDHETYGALLHASVEAECHYDEASERWMPRLLDIAADHARVTKERDEAREQVIWVFSEDEHPTFHQGHSGANEITHLLTAKQAAHVYARAATAESALADRDAEIARLREAVEAFLRWADQKCPCRNDDPAPCPLCGASVDNLQACKAADSTLPRHLLVAARAALPDPAGPDGGRP